MGNGRLVLTLYPSSTRSIFRPLCGEKSCYFRPGPLQSRASRKWRNPGTQRWKCKVRIRQASGLSVFFSVCQMGVGGTMDPRYYEFRRGSGFL